jgi:hypothetical protein
MQLLEGIKQVNIFFKERRVNTLLTLNGISAYTRCPRPKVTIYETLNRRTKVCHFSSFTARENTKRNCQNHW